MVDMTDVIVKFDLKDADSESRLFQAVNQFAAERECMKVLSSGTDDAPLIMVKTTSFGEGFKKSVIFQDRRDAENFMYYWRRFEHAA